MEKTYQYGLVKGYKIGVKEGKQEALIELQKNNPNKGYLVHTGRNKKNY